MPEQFPKWFPPSTWRKASLDSSEPRWGIGHCDFGGVYAWCDEGTRQILYVGEAGSIYIRLREHFRPYVTPSTFIFHGHHIAINPVVFVCKIECLERRLATERRIIAGYQPLFNRSSGYSWRRARSAIAQR